MRDVVDGEVFPCPCGAPGCLAILRGDNFYEEGFNLEREPYNPEGLLAYGKRLASRGALRPTTDDWAPSFPGGLVAIRVIPLRVVPDDPVERFRIVVSGGDDRAMEKDFASKAEADRAFARLPVYISSDDLLWRGFVWG